MKWTLHPLEQLDALAGTWDTLNCAAGALPFLDSRFMIPLCREFGEPGLRIAVCESAEGPLAMGIFGRRGAVQWDSFQPSQLPLGAWVMRPGLDLEVLLASLAAKLPGMAVAVGLTQQDPNLHSRPQQSARLHTLDYIQTARLPIAGSFDDYWAARGRNLRHNMKRQRAKLQAEGIVPKLDVLTRAEDVAGAIEDYGQLESAGWKAAEGTAIHPDNAQGRFYRAMLESFCATGATRIFRYRFGEKVVAVDLCIEGGGALVILKTTYDESVKAISPAFLMREESFRILFDERRLECIEFFGKVMEWHLRWTDDVRILYHLNFYRSALLSRIKTAATAHTSTETLTVPSRN